MRLHAAARCRGPPQVTNYRLVYASNKGTVVQVRHYPAARSKPGRDSLQLSSYLAGRWMRAASAQGCSAGAAAVPAADRAAGNALGQMEGRQGHRLGRADAGAPCCSPLAAPGQSARNGARTASRRDGPQPIETGTARHASALRLTLTAAGRPAVCAVPLRFSVRRGGRCLSL